MVAVATVCADTDERAQWLARPSALSFLRLRQGRPQALATPEEAAAYPYTDVEREFMAERWEGQAIGSPETVRQALAELMATTRADELMLTALVYDVEDRIRSFELAKKAVTES
jgi:alkanesulfonate monooxygenase SsuD/methylene tetrahydromethanopterin reductase-like flavin-dependent oxidoreductase (luciferase family)